MRIVTLDMRRGLAFTVPDGIRKVRSFMDRFGFDTEDPGEVYEVVLDDEDRVEVDRKTRIIRPLL